MLVSRQQVPRHQHSAARGSDWCICMARAHHCWGEASVSCALSPGRSCTGVYSVLTYCQCPQLAGCLFAAHAVHVESVASVVGRADVVCAVFALAALVAYRRAAVDAGATSFGWLAAAIVLVLLGTLGKEVRCVSLCVCVCVCVCACVCACVCVCVCGGGGGLYMAVC